MKKLLFAFFSFVLILLVVTPLAFAQTIAHQETVILEKNKTINADYFATGESVTVSGTVNGDTYIAAGIVLIDGTINGDLLVAGGTVTIRGNIKNDVRAAGGTVIISSPIGGNLTVAAGTAHITDAAKIEGSLVAGAGTLEVYGPVGKGATIGAGQATIANSIGNDIQAGIGQLTITSNAKVNGDIIYISEEEANIASDASVSGKITRNIPEEDFETGAEKAMAFFAGVTAFTRIINFVSSLILGLLLIKFAPQFTQKVVDQVAKKPWLSLFIGFLTFVISPVLLLILFATLVGIPIALLYIALLFITVYFSKIFVAILIGEKVMRFFNRRIATHWAFVVGMILYLFVTSIPVIGWFVGMIIVTIGTGAILLEKRNFYSNLRSKKLL